MHKVNKAICSKCNHYFESADHIPLQRCNEIAESWREHAIFHQLTCALWDVIMQANETLGWYNCPYRTEHLMTKWARKSRSKS